MIVPVGVVTGLWFILGFGILLGLVSLLGVFGLVQRVVNGGPSVELLDDPVAGQVVGVRAQLPGNAKMVVGAEVQITVRSGSSSRARQQRVDVQGVEGKTVELLVELPEAPEGTEALFDLRIRPISKVPFVDQQVPNESLEVNVTGIPLLVHS